MMKKEENPIDMKRKVRKVDTASGTVKRKEDHEDGVKGKQS